MARTRQRSQKSSNISAGAGTGAQQQQAHTIPAAFVYGTIIPSLQTVAQRCLTEYDALKGLIAQCQFANLFGSSLVNTSQPMPAIDPSAATGAGSPTALTGQQFQTGAQVGAQQDQGIVPTGTVGKEPTIDNLILLEMDNFPNGFTAQEMRAFLTNKYGPTREKPIRQNHVSNALRKHWENNRMWAVGGNPLTKQPVDRWYSPSVPRPAGAYSQALQQGQLAQAS